MQKIKANQNNFCNTLHQEDMPKGILIDMQDNYNIATSYFAFGKVSATEKKTRCTVLNHWIRVFQHIFI